MVGVERPEIRSVPKPLLGEIIAPLLENPPQFFDTQLREIGIFHGAIDINHINDEGNQNGFNNEQRVGKLVARIGVVKDVRQVEYNEELNGRMVDLVVNMQDDFSIPQVFIQVKSSRGGIDYFFRELAKKINGLTPDESLSEYEKYVRKRVWMAEQGLIAINAGERNDKPATDEYILDKFQRDLAILIVCRDLLKQHRSDQMQASYIQSLSDLK